MICPHCEGDGYVERKGWFGPGMEPCPYCYDGLGEVPDDDDSNDSARTAPGNNG